jgi:hypothetical protein
MNPAPTRSPKKITCLRVIGIVITLAAGTIWLQDLTSRPDLRKFDPVEMGNRETSMWRSYYEGHWVRLGWEAFRLSCSEYGFSWWDSGRASAYAAVAALHFRRNTNDPRCLPLLEKYYQVIENGVSGEIPVAEAAKRELEWWRERRRKLPPEKYAKTIARLASLIYGGETARYLDASEKRAAAMKFRDDHREGTMEEADWEHVSGMLQSAYSSLKDSLSGQTGELP